MFWNPLNILSICWISSYSLSLVLLGEHADAYMKKKISFLFLLSSKFFTHFQVIQVSVEFSIKYF